MLRIRRPGLKGKGSCPYPQTRRTADALSRREEFPQQLRFRMQEIASRPEPLTDKEAWTVHGIWQRSA